MELNIVKNEMRDELKEKSSYGLNGNNYFENEIEILPSWSGTEI